MRSLRKILLEDIDLDKRPELDLERSGQIAWDPSSVKPEEKIVHDSKELKDAPYR